MRLQEQCLPDDCKRGGECTEVERLALDGADNAPADEVREPVLDRLVGRVFAKYHSFGGVRLKASIGVSTSATPSNTSDIGDDFSSGGGEG